MKKTKRTYTITIQNEFLEPYSVEDSPICRHKSIEEYQTDSYALCQKIVKDLLDVPEANLTLEQIRKDFENPKYGTLPEEKLVQIQNYYNGRLAIWKRLTKDLDKFVNRDNDESKRFHFDIPEDYNSFYVYGEKDNNIKQNSAFIEVNIENI